jgi:hypothetical protein
MVIESLAAKKSRKRVGIVFRLSYLFIGVGAGLDEAFLLRLFR